jgi:tRNA(Arg) A34 adenosine deaminase TadA
MSLILPVTHLTLNLPAWIKDQVDWDRRYPEISDRMRLAIDLARENVSRKTGGPFGAAVFEQQSGRLISVGINNVVRLANSSMHAEIMAFMLAQARVGTFSLAQAAFSPFDLATSCEPCAMCLGAILWSGVSRVICGATREDALQLGFEEGPVFPESYAYLEARGLTFLPQVLREEASAVLQIYRDLNGPIYNS